MSDLTYGWAAPKCGSPVGGPGRVPSPLDLLLNIIGIALALWLYRWGGWHGWLKFGMTYVDAQRPHY